MKHTEDCDFREEVIVAHSTFLERIARLEETDKHLIAVTADLVKELKEIKGMLSKWQGIAGGIILTVTCLWAFVNLFMKTLWNKFFNA